MEKGQIKVGTSSKAKGTLIGQFTVGNEDTPEKHKKNLFKIRMLLDVEGDKWKKFCKEFVNMPALTKLEKRPFILIMLKLKRGLISWEEAASQMNVDANQIRRWYFLFGPSRWGSIGKVMRIPYYVANIYELPMTNRNEDCHEASEVMQIIEKYIFNPHSLPEGEDYTAVLHYFTNAAVPNESASCFPAISVIKEEEESEKTLGAEKRDGKEFESVEKSIKIEPVDLEEIDESDMVLKSEEWFSSVEDTVANSGKDSVNSDDDTANSEEQMDLGTGQNPCTSSACTEDSANNYIKTSLDDIPAELFERVMKLVKAREMTILEAAEMLKTEPNVVDGWYTKFLFFSASREQVESNEKDDNMIDITPEHSYSHVTVSPPKRCRKKKELSKEETNLVETSGTRVDLQNDIHPRKFRKTMLKIRDGQVDKITAAKVLNIPLWQLSDLCRFFVEGSQMFYNSSNIDYSDKKFDRYRLDFVDDMNNLVDSSDEEQSLAIKPAPKAKGTRRRKNNDGIKVASKKQKKQQAPQPTAAQERVRVEIFGLVEEKLPFIQIMLDLKNGLISWEEAASQLKVDADQIRRWYFLFGLSRRDPIIVRKLMNIPYYIANIYGAPLIDVDGIDKDGECGEASEVMRIIEQYLFSPKGSDYTAVLQYAHMNTTVPNDSASSFPAISVIKEEEEEINDFESVEKAIKTEPVDLEEVMLGGF